MKLNLFINIFSTLWVALSTFRMQNSDFLAYWKINCATSQSEDEFCYGRMKKYRRRKIVLNVNIWISFVIICDQLNEILATATDSWHPFLSNDWPIALRACERWMPIFHVNKRRSSTKAVHSKYIKLIVTAIRFIILYQIKYLCTQLILGWPKWGLTRHIK